jgi:hypothetical protein
VERAWDPPPARQATRPPAPANPATTTAPTTKGSGDPADVLATADDGVTFRILGPDDAASVPGTVSVDGDRPFLVMLPDFGVVPLVEGVDPGATGVAVE